MPKIYLYAEVLTHLRQLTLHASLETEKNEETKIDISSDKKIITVIHDGESSSLYLPTQISGTAQVTFPLDKKTEISARVQIEDLEQWKETDAAGIEAPWNASELSFESSVTCIGCDAEILPMGTISSWKDLPTQHWAEVMDLWFCHKPHEHSDGNQEQQAAEAKGFSAQSRLASKPGVGMVDLVSFAIHPDDCNNIEIFRAENKNSLKAARVLCARCHLQAGSFSPNENLVRLNKACVKVKSSRDQPIISYPPTTFISAELLEIVESTAIRKVIVYCPSHDPIGKSSEVLAVGSDDSVADNANTSDTTIELAANEAACPTTQPAKTNASESQDGPKSESQTQPLLLWIFNPDIYYSSSRLTTIPKQKPETDDVVGPLSAPDSSSSLDPPRPPVDENTATAPSTTPLPQPSNPLSSRQATPPPPSSSLPATTSIALPHRAQKIFYRPLTPQETTLLHLSSTPQPQHEHLPLANPQHLASLHQTLETSTSMLPATARAFGDFAVGLLDRYERHGSAERVMEANPLARRLQGDGDLAADGRPRVTRWEMPQGAHELYL